MGIHSEPVKQDGKTIYVYNPVEGLKVEGSNSGQSEKQMEENMNRAETNPSSVDLSSPPPAETPSPEPEERHGGMSETGWANLEPRENG